MRSRERTYALVAVLIVTGAIAAPRLSGPAASAPRIAPDFTLTECVNADTLRLSSFGDRPVLLFFYDGGSMASHFALPYVCEWHRRYAGDGLQVIGVHSPALEPLMVRYNAVEVVSRAHASFPVGMDYDRAVYRAYGLDSLPAYVLLKPGCDVVFETAEPLAYVQVEQAIQKLLAERKPDIVNPFITKPMRPLDVPGTKLLAATPMVDLGYTAGAIIGCDSSARDVFRNYIDPRGRERGKIYLQGYWKVGPNSVAYEQKYRSSEDHLRVIYSGKEVWLLPGFQYAGLQRIHVRQDRKPLPKEDWGKDILGDDTGKPYVFMQYSIPVNIVKNRAFGAHELELIPAEGDVAFYYLFFEGDAAQ